MGAVHKMPLRAVKQTSMKPSTNALSVLDFRFGSREARDTPTIKENVTKPGNKWRKRGKEERIDD